jgi:TRAP-type C4-dicarboxylate transport system substrate-binding protein
MDDIEKNRRLKGAKTMPGTQMGDDGYFLGNVPIGGVLRLPMLLRTLADYDKAAAIMNPYLEKAFEKKGLLVLGQYLYPFQVAFRARS